MRTNTIFALAVFPACHAIAQPRFEKFYITSAGFNFNFNELPSKNLFVSLGCGQGVSRIDSIGGVLHSQCYYPSPMVGINSLRKRSGDEYYFVTLYRKDSCSTSGSFTVPYTHPAIGRMDTSGNVLAYRHYVFDEGCWNGAGDLTVTADNGVITWGRDKMFMVLRVDSQLAPVWGKRFNYIGGFKFVKELPSGDLLAGINMDGAGAVVARMDANGNFLWVKSYFRPKGMVHDAVIESDDSFIITGFTDSTSQDMFIPLPTSFQPKLFMMKLDGDGEVQWCRGYNSAPNLWYTPRPSRIWHATGP